MKIAKFKTSMDSSIIYDEGGETSAKSLGWVRLTEYVEVTFPPLPRDVVVEGQLKQLDAAEAELRTKFQEKLNQLANERAKLLSLTHESVS